MASASTSGRAKHAHLVHGTTLEKWSRRGKARYLLPLATWSYPGKPLPTRPAMCSLCTKARAGFLECLPHPQGTHDTGLHPHPRRAPAQPQEPRPRHPHRRDDGGHRAERLGQVEPGVRHALRRRPAPLRRDLLAPTRASSSTAWTGRRSTRSTACRRRSRSTRPTRCARSRSTVGTMTELNDHLKLLFARAAQLFDRETALPVRHDSPETIYAELMRARARGGDPRAGADLPGRAAGQHQRRGGRAVAVGQRLHARAGRARGRDADRAAQGARRGGRPLPHRTAPRRSRVIEAIEVALKRGSGRLTVYALAADEGASPRSGTSRPACTAPKATSATPTRSRRCSPSTRPTAPARPAAASAA